MRYRIILDYAIYYATRLHYIDMVYLNILVHCTKTMGKYEEYTEMFGNKVIFILLLSCMGSRKYNIISDRVITGLDCTIPARFILPYVLFNWTNISSGNIFICVWKLIFTELMASYAMYPQWTPTYQINCWDKEYAGKIVTCWPCTVISMLVLNRQIISSNIICLLPPDMVNLNWFINVEWIF